MSITNLQIADNAFAVTPNDSTVLEPGVLFIGNGGAVAVQTLGGQTETFENVPDGSILYVMVTKVLATGTDATGIKILR